MSSLLVLALVAPAQAASSAQEEVDQLHTEGLVLYRAGKYKQALPKFEEAYRKFPDATILFNVGKCLEALGEIDRAIGTYRAVAGQPNAEGDLVARAKTRIDTLETAKLKSRTEAIDDESPREAPAQLSAPEPRPAAAVTGEVDGGSWMTAGKWTFLGVGAAVAISGGIVFGLGYGDHQKIERAIDETGSSGIASLTQSQAQALLDSGSDKKNIGYGLLGAGAAAIATSAVLFVLDVDAEPSVSVSGMASADGAGAILSGRFF